MCIRDRFKNRIERTKVDFSTDASGDERDTSGHGTKVAGAIAKSTPSNVKLFAYKKYLTKTQKVLRQRL